MVLSLTEFPNSIQEPFIITSHCTNFYNCIAWAYGVNDKWFWPTSDYYWPASVPCELTITAFQSLFEEIGYVVCQNGDYINGYEKIAIFIDADGKPTHAARQLNEGYWTSKLGSNVDVSHTLNAIIDGSYGIVGCYMIRHID